MDNLTISSYDMIIASNGMSDLKKIKKVWWSGIKQTTKQINKQ